MRKLSKQSRRGFMNYGIVIIFFVIMQLLSSGKVLSSSLQGQLVPICAYVVMALSLNLVVGFSGELSLGHAGFMSVGAFTGVIAATAFQNSIGSGPLRLLVSIIVAAIFAAISGIIIGIPVLRLQGDYLAIVTLAFGEIIKNVLNCLYVGVDNKGLHFSMTDANSFDLGESGVVVLNGPMGALGITKLSSFFSGIVLIIIALFVIQNLVNSRSGRAIKSIRDNKIAAEACGIQITKYRMMAFVTSASLAGAAGALYALNFSTVVPKKFDFNTSILILVFVVLGGIGNLTGTMIAAALLTVLPELLRQFQDYRMLVYAIVLILVMLITNNARANIFVKRIEKSIKQKIRELFSKKGAGV